MDAFAPEGSPIYAPESGLVTPKLFQFGGYAAFMLCASGMQYYLAHGMEPFVAGRVQQGQQIGKVGSTGTGPGGYAAKGGTAPHVHFAAAPDGDFSRGYRGGSGTVWFEPWVWGK